MAKLAQNFAKYMITAKMKASGVVEKPDVIGAIFGQTEGLLGNDMDLRELQKTGRIGRIEVIVKTEEGLSEAEISIPSSLDASETSLIAASLETIDKVGPCEAEIKVDDIKDLRSMKRRYVVDRAKELLKDKVDDGLPDSQRMSEMIKEAVRSWEVSDYSGLSCGPDIENVEDIIVVEGRADVINLLKNGIRNVIAIEGSKIPDPIIQLTKEKMVTAFLDGDRGGELDLQKLKAVADIDFVARAEEGLEVEDLSKKEIYKALREKIPADKSSQTKISTSSEPVKEKVTEIDKTKTKTRLNELVGTRAAYITDENDEVIKKLPLSELGAIPQNTQIRGVIFDGKINQDIIDMALQRRIKYIAGMEKKSGLRAPRTLILLSAREL